MEISSGCVSIIDLVSICATKRVFLAPEDFIDVL
jgi:hypothetical protein